MPEVRASLRTRPARLAAALVLGLAAVLPLAVPAAAADTAKVRVLHASFDAPAVDVYVDGAKVLSNVAFKGISSYLPVPAGSHALAIKAAGTSTTVISTNATVAAGKSYTVAAIDPLASIKFAVFDDTVQPVEGSAKLRVVHLSPDAPAVDVAVAGQAPAQAPVKNLAYPNATQYISIPGGTYHFEVRAAGTTTVALDLPGVKLQDGMAYTVFAVGSTKSETAGQKLSAVLAADAMLPPTSSTETGPDGSGLPWYLVAAAALAALAGVTVFSRRVVAERARR